MADAGNTPSCEIGSVLQITQDMSEPHCAAVEWSSGEPESFTIHINRTVGQINEEGKFHPTGDRSRDAGMLRKRCSKTNSQECQDMFRHGDSLYVPGAELSRWKYKRAGVTISLQILVGDFATRSKQVDPKMGYPFSGTAPHASFVAMPFPEREIIKQRSVISLGDGVGNVAGALVSFIFMMNVLGHVARLVAERDEKRKEGLRMVGCSPLAYYGHWVVYGCCQSAAYSIMNTFLWYSLGVISNYAAMPAFLMACFLFFLDLALLGFVMSTFLGTALMSQLLTMVVYTCTCSLTFLPKMPNDWLFMFIPQVAYSKALGVFVTREIHGWEADYSESDSYTLLGTLSWLLLDAIVWGLLWLYLDQVIPHGGTVLKPWFPCTSGYWRGDDGIARRDVTNSEASDPWLLNQGTEADQDLEVPAEEPGRRRSVDEALAEEGRSSLIEAVDRGMIAQILAKNCVKVDDLCVYFKGAFNEEIRAVDGVNLIMFPGEIFALLGHNGAGKSTTMSALCGLLTASSGRISIFGQSMPQDIASIRKSMGFCPQHDVLFPALTVVEHISLFSRLAGRPASAEAEVFKLVADIGLESRANFQVTALSGGMKRKLSVGLAFSGDPKLVVLDEPTSGMDPFSRRGLWDFLKLRRQGRVMLLTTHFMDEAGVLGDRVAIMRAGKVEACGTGDFLKRRFGCGYVLTIVMKERGDSHDPVKELLVAILGPAPQISGVGKELLVNVPMDLEQQLSSCLVALAEKKSALSVATFGVSVSNLEEVFLKVASGEHGNKQQEIEAETSFQAAMQEIHNEPQGPCFVMPNPGGTVVQQMRGLLERRVATAARDKKTFNMGCLCPVVMLFFATSLGAMMVSATTPGAAGVGVPIQLEKLEMTIATNQKGDSEGATFLEDATDASDAFACKPPWRDDLDRCSVSDTARGLAAGYFPQGYLAKCMSEGVLETDCRRRWVRYLLAFDNLLMKRAEQKPQDIGLLFLDGFPIIASNMSYVAHGFPLAVNKVFEKVAGLDMKLTTEVMPMTKKEAEYYRSVNIATQASASFLVAGLSNFAFCFVPVAVLGYVLMEKNQEVKHQLMISGCSSRAYWFSMLLWDCVFAAVPVLALYGFLHFYGFEAFTTYWETSVTLLLLFTPAAVGLAYLLSFATSSPAIGNVCLMVCNGVLVISLVFLFLFFDVFLKAIPVVQTLSNQGDEGSIGNLTATLKGNCAEVTGTYQAQCQMMRNAQVAVPILKGLGFFLPGFSLLDGLLRITGRHVFVTLLFPSLLEKAGLQLSSMLVQGSKTRILGGCGEVIDASTVGKIPDVGCENFVPKFTRQEFNPENCLLGQWAAMLDKSQLGQLGEKMLMAMTTVEAMGLSPEEQQKALEQLRKHAASPAVYLAGMGSQQLIKMLPEEENKIWTRAQSCLSPVGRDLQVFASILAAHGDLLGKRIDGKIREFAGSPAVTKNADLFLPHISGVTTCTVGPVFGPFRLADLLPNVQVANMTQTMLNSSIQFGPLMVKVRPEKDKEKATFSPRALPVGSKGLRLDALVFLSSCPQRHGHFAIKKMLHPQSMELFCLMEIPGSEHQQKMVRSSLQAWLGRWSTLQAQHPKLLVAVREAFWEAPVGYPMAILCEYMPQGSLHDLIQACGGLPEEAMREIAHAVLQALDVLHSAGMVHGCVKPSQVLFSASGRTRLTFGLEQRIKSSQAAACDVAGAEQSTVVDIFDLGLLLLVSALGGMDVLLEAIPYARSLQQNMASPRGGTRELLMHELRATPEAPAPADMGYLPPASDLLFNRDFSLPFLSFLSSCLESHAATNSARDLLRHEFLQSASSGPSVSLREMQNLAQVLNEDPSPGLVRGTGGTGRLPPSVAQSAQLYLMNIAQSIAPYGTPREMHQPRKGPEWDTLLVDTSRTLGLPRATVQAALETQLERAKGVS
ncbi:unnamed protein product [Effrenium voratum]|nr:unnamed protein product [Effrenium voratum]